ncbi:MAG: hypothetical protein KF805_16525 [Phycisphaeraceae bacterium]|nr:hypothetical protein [Phycisphaeraceae bacterium]
MNTGKQRGDRLRRMAIVLVTGACCSSAAAVQTFEWSAPGSGSWFEPSNWNPMGVPTLDVDTARIGGSSPLEVEIAGANASIGFLRIENSSAAVTIRSGRTMSLGQGGLINGRVNVGEGSQSELTALRLGTLFSANTQGSGRIVLRGSPAAPLLTQLVSPSPWNAMYVQGLAIEGVGALVGNHRILGRVLANGGANAVLELRAGTFDGFGTGRFTADGGVLRVFQSSVTDAILESFNGGVVELSPPGTNFGIMANRCTIRGSLRTANGTSKLANCDFDADLEIIPGTNVEFVEATKPLNIRANVHSRPGSASSTLTLPSGTPSGSGDIVLNAETLSGEANLIVNQITLGNGWNARGQGLITGGVQLDGTIVAERTTGPALAFSGGTVAGPGTMHAKGGMLDFREKSVVQNVHILATDGGSAGVSRSDPSGPTRWVAVVADVPQAWVTGGELKLEGTTVNGSVRVDGARLTMGVADSVIEGDVLLNNSTLYKASQLRLESGIRLLGAGEIVLQSLSEDSSMSSVVAAGQVFSADRVIRGSGELYGGFGFLGLLRAEGALPLVFRPGTYDGQNQGVIEIAAGGSIRMVASSSSDMSTIKNCHIVAEDGAGPMLLGRDTKITDLAQRVFLTSVDVDADCVTGQRGVVFRDARVRRPIVIDRASWVQVYGATRFDGEMIFRPAAGFEDPVVTVNDAATQVSAIRFENTVPGVSAGVFVQGNGALGAAIRGTGSISTQGPLGGIIAPSDESARGASGVLWFANTPITLLAQSATEVGIRSVGSYDRILADKGVAVNGTLRLTVDPAFYPPPAYNFHVYKGAATGAFHTIVNPPGYRVTMIYNKSGAIARLTKLCGADFNGDGEVNDEDFSIFCASYDLLLCDDPAMAPGCPGDLNREGTVDDEDFRIFVQQYQEFICPTE